LQVARSQLAAQTAPPRSAAYTSPVVYELFRPIFDQSFTEHSPIPEQDLALMSNKDALDLKESQVLFQSERSSADSYIAVLESRILHYERLNHDICEEKIALAARVKSLEATVRIVGGRASVEPQDYGWKDSASVQDNLMRNINYINFCTAAADICRTSDAVDLKEVKLLRLISSFLVHSASVMDCFTEEAIIVESFFDGRALPCLNGRIDDIQRYQAMNVALCSLIDRFNAETCTGQRRAHKGSFCC
jgi:hypothetical protein